MGDEGRARAQARGCGSGLSAGMPAADHNDVEARIHQKFLGARF
jgi:hypothetical protein